MKRVSIIAFLFLLAFCKTPQPGSSRTAAIPGHGAISVDVVPNPVVARPAGGNMYDFPLDVVVHETAGRAVTVSRVTVTVSGPAGIRLGDETWSASQIGSAGFSTNLPGNGELRYHFVPRKSVPDDRLFGSVRAELRVDAYDETSTPTSASTTVTVTR